MARRVLPMVDLRTPEQRRGLSKSQRNIQAITGILQILGQAEQVRRERQTLDRIVRALGEGKTTAEAIAAVTRQEPGFGTGIQGMLQRVGGAFQPQGGGARQDILRMIVGQRLQQALTPPKPFTLGPGQERFTGAGERVAGVPKAPKPTKIQELVNEGYSLEEARMIRDISHGLKPRASARKQYENLSDVEKMDFLSKLKQRAEGQYYGIEGGNLLPRQPKLLKWVNEELKKLSILQEETGATDEPQSQEEFTEKVQSIEDKTEAEAYYNKWIHKWQ